MTLVPQATESQIQCSILDLLAAERVFAVRLNTFGVKVGDRVLRSHSGGAGMADILAFPNLSPMYSNVGITPLWIEVKTLIGKQTPIQHAFQLHVEMHGHSYLLARSAEEVLSWLQRHKARY